ncbi:hypothetical protein QTJ16_002096 [Diplocarpon rosae]|uniref:tripeptidyl-peptidase II n=1 Tax=Diplocarpon rosae TaxID=946125 RepID=A0AAD9T511_9HELO|nr:hypothetical protein QTJ16_002096 [Diplocarpon rosae]
MLGPSLLLSVAFAAQAVFGSPIRSRSAYSVKETHTVPREWSQIDQAPKNHMLHLQIGLKQNRFDELERKLHEVSDPSHLRYGKHLSFEEVNDLIRPSDETLDSVQEWLSDNDIPVSGFSPAKDWINVHIDVESAERLLGANYSLYKHEDGSQLVRTSEWSLPVHLHEMVDTIQPTTSFMRSKPQAADWRQFAVPYLPQPYNGPRYGTIAQVCQPLRVTIECIRTLYGTRDYKPKATTSNKIGFNNFLQETPIRPDIHMFLESFRPEAASTAYTFQSLEIDGGPPASNHTLTAQRVTDEIGKEANLDAQTILGIGYPTPVISYSTGNKPPSTQGSLEDTNEPFLTWVNYALAQEDVPQVISSSYSDDERTVPKAYAERVCKSFASLGIRGVTMLVSSGDNGLGGEKRSACASDDGKSIQFIPSFPASCPYVTAVGATEQFGPEVAAWRPSLRRPDGKMDVYYASGSGFSNYFPRPEYQHGVVDDYLTRAGRSLDGFFNRDGRGYPDISAQGLHFAFVWNQKNSVISGTSVSSPIAASVISLLNDHLLSTGRPPLGFLNPWLYKKGKRGFTDIFLGRTLSCGTEGFPVAWGWDPVTGFGTADFSTLVTLLDGNSTVAPKH